MEPANKPTSSRGIRILITGATGLAGSGVLDECLDDPRVEKVTALTRKSTGRVDPKLVEIIHQDFLDYSAIEDKLVDHDACFWCLGISQAQAGGEESYRRITRDYTMKAAEILSRVNKNMTFLYISGMGTNIKSRTMWARVKGETERDLGNFGFKANYNLRPAMIYSVNDVRHSLLLYRLFAYLTPITRRIFPYQHISNRELGRAMINLALNGSDMKILENIDLRSNL